MSWPRTQDAHQVARTESGSAPGSPQQLRIRGRRPRGSSAAATPAPGEVSRRPLSNRLRSPVCGASTGDNDGYSNVDELAAFLLAEHEPLVCRRGLLRPGEMSSRSAWLVSVLVGLGWVVGAALVTREVWEPGSIKHTLIGAVPAVLIVLILRDVLQRRRRNAVKPPRRLVQQVAWAVGAATTGFVLVFLTLRGSMAAVVGWPLAVALYVVAAALTVHVVRRTIREAPGRATGRSDPWL